MVLSCRRLLLLCALGWLGWLRPERAACGDFSDVEPILQEHCVECHGTKEPEGGLVLETYADLLKGGDSGPAIVVGKAAESRLVKALEGDWGKTGKNQFMPPGKRPKLKPEQIAVFKAWIDGGALGSARPATPRELVVPKILPKAPPRRPVTALAFEPKSRLLAVARPDSVELLNVDSRQVVRTLTGVRGMVNSVVFSPEGQSVFAGGGDATGGEVVQWNLADGARVRTFTGHQDAVYALAISSDGQSLATGGYDYAIKLWNLTNVTERANLKVNQGAIMSLAFRPDGRVLASAGYDRTAKVYDAATGARLETFGQALKELNTVVFSPDGRTLLTGGNDNRIRVYRIGADGKEGSNELVATVFAHEGALLRLAFSPDGKSVASSAEDRTVKLFDAAELKPRLTLEAQPDWPTGLAFAGDTLLAVGRADGTLAFYNPADGQPARPPKAELFRTEPRGIERGRATQVKLIGRNLAQATVVSRYRDGKLESVSEAATKDGELDVLLEPASDERLGPWEISVGDGTTESARVKVWIDDLPQRFVTAGPMRATNSVPAAMEWPASVWSTLEQPGSTAEFSFAAQKGQTLVLDLAAQRFGAKGEYVMTLLDSTGRTLAESASRAGQLDPLLVFRVPQEGRYRVRVAEATFGGSAEHFFRLSLGELPLVTGLFPLSVPAHQETEVQLHGANLPQGGRIRVRAGEAGEVGLPESAKAWRARRDWAFLVTDVPAPLETEPNDLPAQANAIPVPVSVNGRLEGRDSQADVDLFRFNAQRGVTYVVETSAATRGSPADTRIEVLTSEGRPVERVRLQAVRNSAVTFRAETSDDTGIRFDNWEEMELNDLLWCGGEVMKILRAPQGPDSDTVMYSANGLRRGYFDTSPVGHYLDEPVYLVKPLAPVEQPVPNGLPIFTLNYVNEDAALRDLGTDSRLLFTAPATADYLIRVSDARGCSGSEFAYRLVVREANPGFTVSLNGAGPTVAAGSGASFDVSLKRFDGFEGSVRVDFDHMPMGWHVPSPLVIEAGHESADASLTAMTNAVAPTTADWDAVTVVATAMVEGRPVAMAVNNLGRPTLAKELPKLLVRLDPIQPTPAAGTTNLPVVRIAPGSTARAKLNIVRNGFDGVVTFSVENLPHGVIVENLGLNGITFLAGENEREISLAAARWVADLDRPFFAIENQAGRQASRPLLLQVRRDPLQARQP